MTAAVRLAARARLRLGDNPCAAGLASIFAAHDLIHLRLEFDDEPAFDLARARAVLAPLSHVAIVLAFDVRGTGDAVAALARAKALGVRTIEMRLADINVEDLRALASMIAKAPAVVSLSGAITLSSLDTLAATGLLGCAAAVTIETPRLASAYVARLDELGCACEIRLLMPEGSGPAELAQAVRGNASVVYLDVDAHASLLRTATRRPQVDVDADALAHAFQPVPAPSPSAKRKGPIVIVGGAGFVGCNLADDLARRGRRVRIVDNLARAGSERNALWLKRQHGDLVEAAFADASHPGAIASALRGAEAIFNFAAQVAVTTSLERPVADFEANARAALNILEWTRRNAPDAPLLFASTNKVYGCLDSVSVEKRNERHEPTDQRLREHGLSEQQPLDLRTPYGCSKGAADQYVLDYAKSFGLRTTVMRMSCIYGPRQFGNEDQGWVAHFLIRALSGEPITIYGDGRQVRDILHVRDAVNAYRMALASIDEISGEAFNLGGGPENAVSLLQLLEHLANICGRAPAVSHEEWRTGDQPWFVADTGRIAARLGWRPEIGWREGVADLARWIRENLPHMSLDSSDDASAPAAATRRMSA